jgi:hypothetical protein
MVPRLRSATFGSAEVAATLLAEVRSRELVNFYAGLLRVIGCRTAGILLLTNVGL